MGLLNQLLTCRCLQRRLGRRRLFLAHSILEPLGGPLWWLRLSSRIFQSLCITLAVGLGATHLLIFRLGIAVLGLG